MQGQRECRVGVRVEGEVEKMGLLITNTQQRVERDLREERCKREREGEREGHEKRKRDSIEEKKRGRVRDGYVFFSFFLLYYFTRTLRSLYFSL